MPQASIERAVRRFAEARGRLWRSSQVGELVEVRLPDLDLRHPRHRRGREAVLDDLPGRQERGRVEEQQADAVEGHQAADEMSGPERVVADDQPSVAEPEDVTAQTVR